MSSEIPKQYLPLHNSTVIEQTLSRLARHPLIKGIVVAIAQDDKHWRALSVTLEKELIEAPGGAERCNSVLNCLTTLTNYAEPEDWVLVHDAARPCLRLSDMDKLIVELSNHPVGGLLAVPVRDTMKRSDPKNDVIGTVDRSGLWHALTPQMFRLGMMKESLLGALEKGVLVTDEASAMELQGLHPHLVEGTGDNIKITHPTDLALAEFYLRQQETL